ncbi:MAG TPA: thiamine pyrophosphate-binding protein [Holophagaceae bacterium]
MMRVADYLVETLSRKGLRDVFMVTGGGAMHLNDAFGRSSAFRVTCCHHEQACAMAAESYFRLSGRLAAVNVTTGPGGLNALSGVHGAFTDSMGMVVVSGQVKRETLVSWAGPAGLRQLGDQEADIVSIVRPLTKYAALVEHPDDIRYHLEKALYLATSGRPGPIWLDVPSDVQAAQVDPTSLRGFQAESVTKPDLAPRIAAFLDLVRQAKRPVLLPGSGIRIAGVEQAFRRLVERLRIPVATAFNAHDLLEDSHPCLVGRPGTVGDRAGNFAVQNADLVIVLGCRLNIRQIGYNWKTWARAARKVMVDVDPLELVKPTLSVDLPIQADLREFFAALEQQGWPEPVPEHEAYLRWCRERRDRYPVVLERHRVRSSPVNPYAFTEALFRHLPPGQAVVTGDGTACVATFQAAKLKEGQRLYSNSGCASMGYDLPASIGASVAQDRGPVVCLAGDGSLMMNLQELQTVAHHRLPILLVIYNNGGYHSIRQTQTTYFPDGLVGFDAATGVSFPDYARIAAAFDLPHRRVDRHEDLDAALSESLAAPWPRILEVMLDPAQPFEPKPSSRRLEDGRMVSAPLEDLAPFLSREELRSNMWIDPVGG